MTTLAELIDNGFFLDRRKLTELDKLEIAKQIAELIKEAHNAGNTLGAEFHPDSFEVKLEDSKLKVESKVQAITELSEILVTNENRQIIVGLEKRKQEFQIEKKLLDAISTAITNKQNPFDIKKIVIERQEYSIKPEDIKKILKGQVNQESILFGLSNSYSLVLDKNDIQAELLAKIKKINNDISLIEKDIEEFKKLEKKYPYTFTQNPNNTRSALVQVTKSNDIWFMGNILQAMRMDSEMYTSLQDRTIIKRPQIEKVVEMIDKKVEDINKTIQDRIKAIETARSKMATDFLEIVNDEKKHDNLDTDLQKISNYKNTVIKYAFDEEYKQVKYHYASLNADPFGISEALKKEPIDSQIEKYAEFVITNYNSIEKYLGYSELKNAVFQKAHEINEARMNRELDELIEKKRSDILEILKNPDDSVDTALNDIKSKLSSFSGSTYKSIQEKYNAALLNIFSLKDPTSNTEQSEKISDFILTNLKQIKEKFNDVKQVAQLEEAAIKIRGTKAFRDAASAAEKKRLIGLKVPDRIIAIVEKHAPDDLKINLEYLVTLAKQDSKLAEALYRQSEKDIKADKPRNDLKSEIAYQVEILNKMMINAQDYELLDKLMSAQQDVKAIALEPLYEERMRLDAEIRALEGQKGIEAAIKEAFTFRSKQKDWYDAWKKLTTDNIKLEDQEIISFKLDGEMDVHVLSDSKFEELLKKEREIELQSLIEADIISVLRTQHKGYDREIQNDIKAYEEQIKEIGDLIEKEKESKDKNDRLSLLTFALKSRQEELTLLKDMQTAPSKAIDFKKKLEENQKQVNDTIKDKNKNISLSDNIFNPPIKPTAIVSSKNTIDTIYNTKSTTTEKFYKEISPSSKELYFITKTDPKRTIARLEYAKTNYVNKLKDAWEKDPVYTEALEKNSEKLKELKAAYQALEEREIKAREEISKQSNAFKISVKEYSDRLKKTEGTPTTEYKTMSDFLNDYNQLISAYDQLVKGLPDNPAYQTQKKNAQNEMVKLQKTISDYPLNSAKTEKGVLETAVNALKTALDSLKLAAAACFSSDKQRPSAK
ncbi:MAG: hypothetical protein U1E78_08605 [Gammaproteobacteria bacterium]